MGSSRAIEISSGCWSCTTIRPTIFFTPVSDQGMSLKEMYVVSGLLPSECLYEEHVPCTNELNDKERGNPEMYKPYGRSFIIFLIRQEVRKESYGGVPYLVWTGYLFPGGEIGGGMIECLAPINERETRARIGKTCYESTYTTESMEDSYPEETIFSNFHYQAMHEIGDRANWWAFSCHG